MLGYAYKNLSPLRIDSQCAPPPSVFSRSLETNKPAARDDSEHTVLGILLIFTEACVGRISHAIQ